MPLILTPESVGYSLVSGVLLLARAKQTANNEGQASLCVPSSLALCVLSNKLPVIRKFPPSGGRLNEFLRNTKKK